MRIAYADPPYIGQAKRHYSDDPQCAEVDHAALLADLVTYDGWALSCSSSTLQYLLSMCPPGVRIGAWVKPWAVFKPGINPAYAWEPVIYAPCSRKHKRSELTLRDWVSASALMRGPVKGQKPDDFCYWLFGILHMQAGDEFTDLFPGSGRVSHAWERWQRQLWSASEASA